ncbi:hypothetical protein [Dethiobacter alkaliphilus]|uniref:Uncharacterized protein n=1 Tax=Dethiobacter alkaliphilus AHT 1 TaxID=555088 RepID=C0GDB5_DETAL|nr:hypothetical protein [Dethiobacter alkaliphilus]EEG78636.1 hypothetical protein DealDRAFT_0566 [Dethiobacter alkaliphilus AHT 1]
MGLEFYQAKTNDEDIDGLSIQIQDFGYHQEIYIFKNEDLVMKLEHADGQIDRM